MILFIYWVGVILWALGASGWIVYRHETERWPNTIYDDWLRVGMGVFVVGLMASFAWPVTIALAGFIILIRLAVKALLRQGRRRDR